jgi:hypothetical protein
MEFRTKLDFSSNRQIKQLPETNTVLSGATYFGVPYSALTTGPNLSTSAVTNTINGVVSTFYGTSSSTTYNWYTNAMSLGESQLSALTPSNSALTQNTNIIFTSNTTSIIDGNNVTLSYSGLSFDLTPISMIDLGGGNYSGTVYTDILTFYSADTLDFTGRTIWVDVSGITRTQKLIITNVGAGPAIIDIGVDVNGLVVNQASDIKLKENINTITGALAKVRALRGVTYNWKDRINGGNDLKIGFIAQEVNDVVPELVFSNNEYLGVHYKDITALLVEAIKELSSLSSTTLNTQTIVAEDNNIELNYNGSRETAVGGGIVVLSGVNETTDAKFIIDESGNWITNNSLKPKSLIIPTYTPTNSNDIHGNDGDIVKDENFLYLKINNKWKRTNLENF